MKLLKLVAPIVLVLSISVANAQSEPTAEQVKKIERRFKALDINKDGKVSTEEFLAKNKKNQGEKYDDAKSKNKFNKFDEDKDGDISKEELTKRMLWFFNKKKK